VTRRNTAQPCARRVVQLKVPKALAVVSGARLSAPQVPYDYAEPEDVGDENYPADLNSMGSGPYESEFYDPQEREAASPGRAQEVGPWPHTCTHTVRGLCVPPAPCTADLIGGSACQGA